MAKDSHKGVFIGGYFPFELKQWLIKQAQKDGKTVTQTLRIILENEREKANKNKKVANKSE